MCSKFTWQHFPWRLSFSFFWFLLICTGFLLTAFFLVVISLYYEYNAELKVLSYSLLHKWPNPRSGSAVTRESPFTYDQSQPTGPNPPVEKAACVHMKGCICWPVCALSQGLGDYVDKRCTWCFRLSFSPPLPPFIPLPSPSPLLLWPFPTFPWDF